MRLYGYHSPIGDGRLFLCATKPKLVEHQGVLSVEQDNPLRPEVGWIEGGAKTFRVPPGHYLELSLTGEDAKPLETDGS